MNDKKVQSDLIILPDQDGVADLDIRRMQSELEETPELIEMLGYMPVKIIKQTIAELKETIGAVERGEVSSLCLITIMPKDSFMDEGNCFFSVSENELGKLDELFHRSLANRPEEKDPDEAG